MSCNDQPPASADEGAHQAVESHVAAGRQACLRGRCRACLASGVAGRKDDDVRIEVKVENAKFVFPQKLDGLQAGAPGDEASPQDAARFFSAIIDKVDLPVGLKYADQSIEAEERYDNLMTKSTRTFSAR